MAAIEQSFTETPPQRLYIDTNAVLAYLNEALPNHERVVGFLQRVHEMGLTTLYLSSTNWLEFGNVVPRQHFRDALPEELKTRLHLAHYDDPAVRKAYLAHQLRLFEDLLGQFPTVEIPLTPEIREAALACVSEYDLRPLDATHIASMAAADVFDLLSFDKAFLRVDGLYLWNDRIYG